MIWGAGSTLSDVNTLFISETLSVLLQSDLLNKLNECEVEEAHEEYLFRTMSTFDKIALKNEDIDIYIYDIPQHIGWSKTGVTATPEQITRSAMFCDIQGEKSCYQNTFININEL